ncbi:MAG: MBL fold metallo-hydrolase [Gemmatimonadales bacterium]|nr:MBL fold metallo-hydrolase [Gemmatimonadales bacterium]NIN11162.1 MBL fold metallo-hydrolase [Gemmatimonadales bacterium]NIN49761.1 MBL fold metallo-hydrolase [Gemmatimonadales bacterium]NIP07225.1 MBL fold metallo-hydrolase [Gemmatimonadales bacterium]NIR00438.1 MBL fold metallo-hydrolase [Gemmatimonadales bacterium]
MKVAAFALLLVPVLPVPHLAQQPREQDVITTSAGDLKITFVGHGTLMFTFNDRVVHVDPVMREADYSKMPKAHVILVTHQHGDHLDPEAIKALTTDDTTLLLSQRCAEVVEGGLVMENRQTEVVHGLTIEAVAAYNLVHMRQGGLPFHPKGEGNGYVITFGDTRVYVAGDTENTPEMKSLEGIDIAFLPMNLPYTMTPEMVADAAKGFRPRILYPYHYGNSDTSALVKLLEGEEGIEIRIRDMS